MRLKLLFIAALAALGACTQSQPTGGAQKTVIRFATDWQAEAEHGGFYEALATGEYAKRGLDVRIIQGGSTVNVPELVASGAVELGDGSNSFIVMNLANAHAPVKAVAAFMQKDPQVLLAHPDAGINSIADMKGYLTSEPYTIETAAKFTPKVFLLADQGYPSYAAMVLAPDTRIAKNPAAVRAFVEASAVGWRDYLHGDPKPADALILKANPEMTEDVLAQAR